MVRRLVSRRFVSRLISLHRRTFCLLATAEHAHLALDVLGRQTAFCQCGTHLVLGVGRKFFPDLIDAGRIARRHLLFKIADGEIIAASPCRTLLESNLKYSLSVVFFNSVGTDHRNLRRAPYRGSADGRVARRNRSPDPRYKNTFSGGSPQEVELQWLRFFLRQFDHIHFIQLFLAGHRHISRGNTRCPCHKILQLRDLLLLTLLRCLGCRFLYRAPQLVVIAHIAVKPLIFHMINHFTLFKNGTSCEIRIDAFSYSEIPFQPLDVLHIQIVRRLVQQQDIWLFRSNFPSSTFVLCPPLKSLHRGPDRCPVSPSARRLPPPSHRWNKNRGSSEDLDRFALPSSRSSLSSDASPRWS